MIGMQSFCCTYFWGGQCLFLFCFLWVYIVRNGAVQIPHKVYQIPPIIPHLLKCNAHPFFGQIRSQKIRVWIRFYGTLDLLELIMVGDYQMLEVFTQCKSAGWISFLSRNCLGEKNHHIVQRKLMGDWHSYCVMGSRGLWGSSPMKG